MIKNPKYILREKYSWHVKLRINDGYHNKRFKFAENGGIKKSLVVAIQYRDRILAENNLIDRLNYKKSPDFTKSKKRLICIGVYFTVHYQHNKPSTNWTTRYSVGNVEIKRNFSINKYGYEEAFRKACKARFTYCGAIRVLNKAALPCDPGVPFIVLP